MTSKITTATLIKLTTNDGLVEFNDDIPIGKVYKIDLSLKHTAMMYNTQREVGVMREVVWDTKGGWLPTECLDWEGKNTTEEPGNENEVSPQV